MEAILELIAKYGLSTVLLVFILWKGVGAVIKIAESQVKITEILRGIQGQITVTVSKLLDIVEKKS